MAKIRLRENFSKDWQEPLAIRKLPIQESSGIIAINEKTYPILEKWEVPVWRLGKKNLNGRTYRESLGKKFVEDYKNTVTANLADHPENDGSVKDILAVSKNPHIRDGILYVDSYIVDEAFEKKLNKMVEAGYGLGVSSSILGELDENNNVIDESAELERWYDFVTAPSYQVYVTKESKEVVEENIKEQIKEEITINNKETVMSDKLKESMEKATRLNLEQILKEADRKDTIALRISSLEEALTYTSDEFLSDMKKSIEEKIANLKVESLELAEKAKTIPVLEESVKNHETEKASIKEKVETLEKEVLSLNEKLEVATKLLDESKEYNEKAESLLEMANAEKGARFTAQEYYELTKVNESLDKSLSEMGEAKATLEAKIKNLEETNKTLSDELSSVKEELAKKVEALANYDKEIEDGVMNEDEEIDYSSKEPFNYENFGPEDNDDELELDVYNTDEIEDYYESLLAENPNYKKIKEDILKCKTLIEAQTTVLRLSSLIEEKFDRPNFLGDSSRKIDESKAREKIENIDVGKIKRKGWK